MVCFCHLFIGAMLPGGRNTFTQAQKNPAGFVQLFLFVCLFSLLGPNTRHNQDLIDDCVTCFLPVNVPIKAKVRVHIICIKKQTQIHTDIHLHRKRCRHTESSHILWEVNNSYCAWDDRREQTCSLSSASLIAPGTLSTIDFSYKHRWVLLSSFHAVISFIHVMMEHVQTSHQRLIYTAVQKLKFITPSHNRIVLEAGWHYNESCVDLIHK